MSLNIKNERVHDLARRLAAMSGKSMTAVIEEALEEKLAKELPRPKQTDAEWNEAFRAFMQRIASGRRPPAGVTSDHSDLYDEHGLPI